MNALDLLPASDEDKHLRVPYEQRWEHLKPIIVELYIGSHGPNGKRMTISQISGFMKDHYSFHAVPRQYQTRFKRWNIRKRDFSTEKEQIISALGRRCRPGESSPNVTLQHGDLEKQPDKKQLKRYLKDQVRHKDVDGMVPGVLSSWSLPYPALVASLTMQSDQPSPFAHVNQTPPYLNINSPAAMTPGREAAGPSPTTQLIQQKLAQDRSKLLLQGRFEQLLMSCNKDERIQLTNYLHEFHIHSFVTAKYWGKGPRFWTQQMVAALTLIATNGHSQTTPSAAISPAPSTHGAREERPILLVPEIDCRWVIHVPPQTYEPLPDQADEPGGFDLQDPSSWQEWPGGVSEQRSYVESMHEAITHSTFTADPQEMLPLSSELISLSLQENPDILQLDALRMAIMTANSELFEELMAKSNHKTLDEIEKIHPYHLAATYLSGATSCCLLFHELAYCLGDTFAFRHNIDDMGHTILDTLMLTILRSHTHVKPSEVSSSFHKTGRFPGEEKDICGRWDVDTPAVREMLRRGHARTPSGWKHPFCHTSAQSICHSIIVVFASPASPRVNIASGLFIQHCGNCGLELKLGPLHVLVMVAFHILDARIAGETMFGALAVLLCLLKMGADASLSTMMSVEDILEQTLPETCHHAPQNAAELMDNISKLGLVRRWNDDYQIGWKCMYQTLLMAQSEKSQLHNENTINEEDLEDVHPHDCEAEEGGFHEWLKLPCGGRKLGLLWAAIQTELLTYRKIQRDDRWISGNFNMSALCDFLTGDTADFCTPLVERGLMQEHSVCGWFRGQLCPVASEVCRDHFMNMDIYSRTKYAERPAYTDAWEDIESIPLDNTKQ